MEEIFEKQPTPRPTILWANLCYLMSAVMQRPIAYFTVMLFGLFAPDASASVMSRTASAIYQMLILGLPGIWYAIRRRETLPSLHLNTPRFTLMLGATALAFAGALLANNLGTWWMLLLDRLNIPLTEQSGVEIPTTAQALTQSILLVGVMPGICEELFFRGMLLGAWERHSSKWAWIVSSVLFALLHGSLIGFPVQLLMGFVLGYLLLMSRSLYVSMMYHTMYNSFTLILAYFSAQISATPDPAIYKHLTEYVQQSIGYFPLLQSTLMTLGLFTLILMLMKRKHPLRLTNQGDSPSKSEWMMLALSIIAVALLWYQ